MGLREELMGLCELLNDDGVLKRLLIKAKSEADAKKLAMRVERCSKRSKKSQRQRRRRTNRSP